MAAIKGEDDELVPLVGTEGKLPGNAGIIGLGAAVAAGAVEPMRLAAEPKPLSIDGKWTNLM